MRAAAVGDGLHELKTPLQRPGFRAKSIERPGEVSVIAHAKPHAPLDVYATTVASDWVDYNGHMNDAAYAVVFSRSVDALMDRVGLDAAARKRTGQTLFTLQMMLHYFKEAKEGDALAVTCQSARARRQAHAGLARHDRRRAASASRRPSSCSCRSLRIRQRAARRAMELRDRRPRSKRSAEVHASMPHPAGGRARASR